MDQSRQTFKINEITASENILALSWKIATEPKLYRDLALNPYSINAAKRG
jgi:hypothetical protein